ncbi:glycine--tRNA ligase [Spiroplasma endosymbiont of Crioceris asparagi]|uniref:glycine--tRNA ligase n=1 Tax=Spiroplasma endosymbiont of Crioceris asparagi TaxID=3066286 RepID=UPI003BAECD87
MKLDMEKLIVFLKSNGFIFQGSEIYGGLANSWDYGPLGSELKKNIKDTWWNYFVRNNELNVGLDSSILLNNGVWKASGHLKNFSDPLIDCKECKTRMRADKIIEEFTKEIITDPSDENLERIIKEKAIPCPICKKQNFTSIRKFMLMYKTNQGVIENENSIVYLRPETAQGIFINFKNIQRSTRKKLPFGVGQIGKSFRNEITPGNFIFRTREFEQMELEFFFSKDDKQDWFEYWLQEVNNFLKNKMLFKQENYILREHSKDELAHYAKRTVDIEYKFPFGVGELWGIAHRADFDLKSHMAESKQDLSYLNPQTNQKEIPYVIEPSVGVERLFLATICNAYDEEKVGEDMRTILKLPFALASYKVAVLPLQKQQAEQAKQIFDEIKEELNATFDLAGQIGKRYRRQDAIGTPFCITVDFDSINDQCVTIRERDTMKQERVLISEIINYIIKNKK